VRAKSSARTELPERGNKTYLQIATTKRFLWPAKINTGPDDVGQFQDSRFLHAERPMRNESLGEYIIFLSSGEWIKLTIYRQIAEKKVYLLRADKGEFKWPLLKARKDKSRRFIASPLSHVHKLFSAVCAGIKFLRTWGNYAHVKWQKLFAKRRRALPPTTLFNRRRGQNTLIANCTKFSGLEIGAEGIFAHIRLTLHLMGRLRALNIYWNWRRPRFFVN